MDASKYNGIRVATASLTLVLPESLPEVKVIMLFKTPKDFSPTMTHETVVSKTTNKEVGTACNSAEAFDQLKSDLTVGFGNLQKHS